MICRNCGARLQESANFCGICGTKVEKEALNRRCLSCGAQLAENQWICTKCGMKVSQGQEKNASSPLEETFAQGMSDGSAMKEFGNMCYAVGKATFTSIQCGSIVMYEDRMDLIKQRSAVMRCVPGRLGGRLGGILGAFFASIVFVAIDLLIKPKSKKVSIFYSTIKGYERGKYGKRPSIIIMLKNGDVYTLVVDKKQDEIFGIIEENVTSTS